MSEVTRILSAIEQGEPQAAEELLPLVYDELRRLAVQKLAQERPGQTLQATALVHEAYVRLVDGPQSQSFNTRGHFFAAAAEAMRRILVENARRRGRVKHGGGKRRVDLEQAEVALEAPTADVLALDEALLRLAEHDPVAVRLVELRYFAGMTVSQAAEILGMSPRKADFLWSFARAWLRRELETG